MSFCTERKFSIKGWDGTQYHMTERELYKRLIEDSKSDYNWIASATQIVKVCNEPDFYISYAIAIKILVLDCFARLELQKERRNRRESTDCHAVWDCYNSLYGELEAIESRNNYLKAIIKAVVEHHFDCPIHVGSTYFKICQEWEKEKYDENIHMAKIDFKELIELLHTDFDKTIKEAENAGLFKEEDKCYQYRI